MIKHFANYGGFAAGFDGLHRYSVISLFLQQPVLLSLAVEASAGIPAASSIVPSA